MKKLAISILFLFSSIAALAQTTAVTATITDSDSTVWINPQWSVQFVPNPNFPNLSSYSIAGVPITSNTYSQYIQVSGTGNGSGVISTTLLDNNQVLPAGSKYRWVVQSQTSAPATTYLPITVTGSSQSLTSALSAAAIAPRFSALFNAYGYADIEISVLPPPGGTYWNTTSATQRTWNGSAWTAGGGGGGTCGTNNIPCTNTANTYTGIQTAPGFAGNGTTQTVLNETQGTAAASPPANTIQRGAPLSVPTSYNFYDPSAAPTDATGDEEICPQGGGTCTWNLPSIVLISSQIVASTATTVTFSSIPQQFHHLKLIISAYDTTGNTSMQINFNSDVTAADYFVSYIVMAFTNTVTGFGSFSNAGGVIGTINPGGGAATVDILGYSNAAFNKTYMVTGTGFQWLNGGGVWNTLAAITRIDIKIASGTTFAAGSTFTLYGYN